MNPTPIILNNTDFQTIIVTVMFPFEETVADLAKIQLLPNMLNKMNNKYPSEETWQLAKKKAYILRTNCSKSVIGTTGCFSFDLVIPDVKSLEKDVLDKQFSLFSELIYNPKVSNNQFGEEELTREIDNVKLGMDNALKNIRPYHSIKLRELVDDEGILSRGLIHHQELLDEITPVNLYEYYLKVIKNAQPVIYIMGDVDSKRITSLCEKYLYQKKFELKTYNANFDNFLKPRKDILNIEEDSTFKDSVFSLVYKVKDMCHDDVILLNALRDILASMSSRLLAEKLRDENDLIYSSKVMIYPHFGLFEITVCINKNNIDLVKEKLFELIDEFKNKDLITKSLNNIKERKRVDLMRQLDDKFFLFDDFVFNDLGVDITFQEYYEKYIMLTAKDISNFVDRLVLDTTYFLKEGNDE